MKHTRRLLLVALALLLGDQLIQHLVLSGGHLAGRRVAPFEPPFFSPRQTELRDRLAEAEAGGATLRALSQHDEHLGWAPRPGGRKGSLYRYDRHGCRISSEELSEQPAEGILRVVTVGCSFTRGDEVKGHETWQAYAEAGREDLEFANLGMGGYGIDQALLRWRRDGQELGAREVWLGIVPTALMRILGHYPPAQRHWAMSVLFKPRFLLGSEGELTLVPNPAPSRAQTLHLLSDHEDFVAALEHDTWLRRSPTAWASKGTSWMHHSALARIFLTLQEGTGRDPGTWLQDPGGELRLLAEAIVGAFQVEAQELDLTFRVLILPGRKDLQRAARGDAFWKAFIDDLEDAGVQVHDLTSVLLAADVADDEADWMPGGHYAPGTNRVVAEELVRLVD